MRSLPRRHRDLDDIEMAAEKSLYVDNHPRNFWRLLDDGYSDREWSQAIASSATQVGWASDDADDVTSLLWQVLGEGQFGPGHWRLSAARRVYYQLKPVVPRPVIRAARRAHRRHAKAGFPLAWPFESRYADFLTRVIAALLAMSGHDELRYIHFWPDGHRCALVLTHDIEDEEGVRNVPVIAELESRMGYRSLFSFVPKRCHMDGGLLQELREQGFEIGIHDLNHDGKLYSSPRRFRQRAALINRHLESVGCRSFRSGLTLRNPLWMQVLDMDYDLSFFDTDPFEPLPGGTMSLWPFWIGRFVELPYTLTQDYTLSAVLGQHSADLWLKKVDFLAARNAMALVNVHPDYFSQGDNRRLYVDFLERMATRDDLWHAVPATVGDWWRARHAAPSVGDLKGGVVATIRSGGWETACVERSSPAVDGAGVAGRPPE